MRPFPPSESSGIVWHVHRPLCQGQSAGIYMLVQCGTYLDMEKKNTGDRRGSANLTKSPRLPKRKSRAMRSLLPDFQIKQRTTAERVMILLVFFSHPQVYAMHMRTFLLTKASLCCVAWLASKGVAKGSKMNSLAKWQASDQWSEKKFLCSPGLQLTGCTSKSLQNHFHLIRLKGIFHHSHHFWSQIKKVA